MLKDLYYEMLRIRRVEEKISDLYEKGYIKAPVHLSIGQEAIAVGVMSALEEQDKIVSTHRCHGHYLAKGGDLNKMLAELLGKSGGCCKGKGGTMHLFDDKAGHVISAPLVGASIAFAVGMALAYKIRKENRVAVAFFGDGAVEEGIFWESLNFASVHRLPVLFVCEHNIYATHSHILKRQPYSQIASRISPHKVCAYNVDGNNAKDVAIIARQAVKLARGGQPCFIEADTYRWKEHWGSGEDWHLGYRTEEEGRRYMEKCPLKKLEKEKSAEKIAVMERIIALEIDKAVEFAINSPAPYSHELMTDVAGSNDYVMKDFAKSESPELTYSEAAGQALLQAMEYDESVILMGEGVDNITGVYGQVLPAYKEFGPERIIDTPLAENALTGIAVGAALAGMRPVLIHQRNDFMLLTMDQMFNQAAKIRYVSGGKHKVPVTILSFVARKAGEGAQHSQSLQSVFAHFPGVKVGMPYSPEDAKGMLLTAIFDDDPVIILEHRSLFGKKSAVPDVFYSSPYSAKFISRGNDLTIVGVSFALEAVREALKKINGTSDIGNISADVIDLRWIRPYDIKSILKSVRKTGRLLVVDTGWKHFSVSSEIIAAVCESAYDDLISPPVRMAMAEAPCPASYFLENRYHPDVDGIIRSIDKLCS